MQGGMQQEGGGGCKEAARGLQQVAKGMWQRYNRGARGLQWGANRI